MALFFPSFYHPHLGLQREKREWRWKGEGKGKAVLSKYEREIPLFLLFWSLLIQGCSYIALIYPLHQQAKFHLYFEIPLHPRKAILVQKYTTYICSTMDIMD